MAVTFVYMVSPGIGQPPNSPSRPESRLFIWATHTLIWTYEIDVPKFPSNNESLFIECPLWAKHCGRPLQLSTCIYLWMCVGVECVHAPVCVQRPEVDTGVFPW